MLLAQIKVGQIQIFQKCSLRLGTHKFKYFGVMNLTSGYHQAPLGAISRIISEFITNMGLYE